MTPYPLQSQKNPWEDEAVVVYYSGGHAEVERADADGRIGKLAQAEFPEAAFLLHPDSGHTPPPDTTGGSLVLTVEREYENEARDSVLEVGGEFSPEMDWDVSTPSFDLPEDWSFFEPYTDSGFMD